MEWEGEGVGTGEARGRQGVEGGQCLATAEVRKATNTSDKSPRAPAH